MKNGSTKKTATRSKGKKQGVVEVEQRRPTLNAIVDVASRTGTPLRMELERVSPDYWAWRTPSGDWTLIEPGVA